MMGKRRGRGVRGRLKEERDKMDHNIQNEG